jgi:sugar phosphate isomerase/epimerase
MKFALMVGAPDMMDEGGYVATPTGLFRETIERAARLGFDGVEILAARRVAGDLYALRKALTNTRIEVAGINSGRLLSEEGLALLCGTSRHCAMTRTAMFDLIRFAAPFRTHINIGMFRGLPPDTDSEASFERLVGILRRFADYAASLNVDLLIEPQNRKEFPFIYSTAEGIKFVEQVNRPNVGIMLDTFHMLLEAENMPASIERAMPYLRHIHLLDKDRNPPSHSSTEIDLPGIMGVLARHRYRHYLSMPLVSGKDDSATVEALRHLRTLKAAPTFN